MLLLPGEGQEEDRAKIAYQLYLGPGGLQRQDVILIEDRHSLQSVVVPGIVAGLLIGDDVQKDLHYPRLPCQLLRSDGHAIQSIPQGDGPGQFLEGAGGLALEIEVGGGLVEPEGRSPCPDDSGGAVSEVHHLVIGAVVGEGRGSVQGVALHHAALHQTAVVVQGGVVRLIVGGENAVAGRGGGRRQDAAPRHQHCQGHRQDPGLFIPLGHMDSSSI